MGPKFFIIMSIFEILACCMFFCIKIPKKTIIEENYFYPSKDEEIPKKSFWANMKETIDLFSNRQMCWLHLNIIWTGVSIAFFSSMLTPIMVLQQKNDGVTDENEQLSQALFGMVAFGFGEVLGGFIHGLIIDKIGSRKTIFVNLIIMSVMTGVTIFSIN
jgi:MFS family permease